MSTASALNLGPAGILALTVAFALVSSHLLPALSPGLGPGDRSEWRGKPGDLRPAVGACMHAENRGCGGRTAGVGVGQSRQRSALAETVGCGAEKDE